MYRIVWNHEPETEKKLYWMIERSEEGKGLDLHYILVILNFLTCMINLFLKRNFKNKVI